MTPTGLTYPEPLEYVIDLPPIETPWDIVACNGLRFLLEQWEQGFPEAAHIMPFPREQGFSSAQKQQYGDVFQRALIADVLCDVNQLLSGQLQPIIDAEVIYLLSRQRTSGIGGWSYFPNLPELPPDADDLAQIMQVLLRAGHRTEMTAYCELPLTVLLEENAHSNGSFETWILPARQRTPEQELQALWVQEAWGTGPDNGVIANLLYALALYDPARFAQVIQRGVAYLEAQQQEDGSWFGTWYDGPYYVTYGCLRLLALVKPESSAIAHSTTFLKGSQHSDGGWGVDGSSDPLNTALALLSFAFVQRAGSNPSDPHQIGKALYYLQEAQDADYSWRNCNFIRMQLGRAQGHVRQILFYGSRTVTTAFVVKAALEWGDLVGE